MTGRRGLALTVALLVAAGALAVASAGRVWARASLTAATGTPTRTSVTGHDVAAAVAPLGIALLALAVAVVAGRGRLRRAAGVVTVLVGAVIVAVAVDGHGGLASALLSRSFAVQAPHVHPDVTPWWVVAVVAGVLGAVGGAVTAVFGGGFPAMGARYQAPATTSDPAVDATASDEAAVWDALDRGEDPTV